MHYKNPPYILEQACGKGGEEAGISKKDKWKVKGNKKETVCKGVHPCTALCIIYMCICMCVWVSASVCLRVDNQRPYVQGCTEPIANPSSVAHLKQNKKHPHQKKPQRREFLKCCTALCTSKRPTSATITRLKSSANNGYLQKVELRSERLKRERRMEQTCVLQPFMLALYASCQQHSMLYVVWGRGESPQYHIW